MFKRVLPNAVWFAYRGVNGGVTQENDNSDKDLTRPGASRSINRDSLITNQNSCSAFRKQVELFISFVAYISHTKGSKNKQEHT